MSACIPSGAAMSNAARLNANARTISQPTAGAVEPNLGTDQQWSAWMAAAQTGDKNAYETLLRSCIPLIKRVARQQRVHPDWIDDVVQETLLSVHDARRTYDPRRSFVAWLRTIAQRRAIDGLRRAGRTTGREVHAPLAYENHPDVSADPETVAFELDRNALLNSAIVALPAGQRDAIEYLALRGHSFADAATVANRTEGSLRVSWHRALRALRAQIDRKDRSNGFE
jgi:RNA polymerase sigma factor (sigma-70 family)